MSAVQMHGAVLTRWAAVKIGGYTHLVGLLLGGHSRISAGRWIITSPVAVYDQQNQIVVTASTGRTYHLLDALEPASIPDEAHDVIARAFYAWRLPADTVVEFSEL